jgi:hypothetical protein
MEPLFDRQKGAVEFLLEDLVHQCFFILRTLELRVVTETTSS